VGVIYVFWGWYLSGIFCVIKKSEFDGFLAVEKFVFWEF
jgi:hypothetical protein